MPLPIAARLGPYEVLAAIGEGGMGEVYKAVDTKLDREVALKVLPAAFAADPERLARFEREARVLASLNHPGIASIYGVEDRALVMELIPGPTLADRIKQGPIPPTEAEQILLQIAEALEYAHERLSEPSWFYSHTMHFAGLPKLRRSTKWRVRFASISGRLGIPI